MQVEQLDKIKHQLQEARTSLCRMTLAGRRCTEVNDKSEALKAWHDIELFNVNRLGRVMDMLNEVIEDA